MKNNFHGEVYPFSNSHYDTQSQVDLFLDLSQADAMAKFMVVLILKMVMSPKLPLSALDYGTDVEQGINNFMGMLTQILSFYVITSMYFNKCGILFFGIWTIFIFLLAIC